LASTLRIDVRGTSSREVFEFGVARFVAVRDGVSLIVCLLSA